MKLYCRVYQAVIYVASMFLPWRQPKLIKGENSLRLLPQKIKELNVERVLIVTDATLMKLGLLNPLLEQCDNDGVKYSLYDKTVPNPTISNIEEALVMYKQDGCQAIVAFGGGSAMDCAKGVGARVARPKMSISQMKGILKILHKTPLLFAIPTTAGTGSETTLAAVITDDKTHYKYPVNDPALFPDYAVLDPLVTVGLPQHITSTTGMDALCHAVEAYIGRSNTKDTKKRARRAVVLIHENLYKAYSQGDNITARENMQEAAYEAGVAFTRAYVGYVHAIAHSLGGQYGIAHGLANAIIMPYVFRAFGSSAHKKLAELADLIGLSKEGENDAQKAERFIAWIEQMNASMNIPKTIPQIKNEDIPLMANHASKEGNPLYPVPKIFTEKELAELYYKIKGE